MCFILSSPAMAQKDKQIIMVSDPNPWGSNDIYNLARWQNIEYHKVMFTGSEIKGRSYYIVSKDICKGVIRKTDTLYKSGNNHFFTSVEKDTLSFSIMGGKTTQKALKFEINFDGLSIMHEYPATISEEYNLRVLDRQNPIETGKPFYAFAYILPYEKDGYKHYCAVESSGKEAEKWGTEFAIEHYVLIEMKFF